mgnify:CR=1 FL=1
MSDKTYQILNQFELIPYLDELRQRDTEQIFVFGISEEGRILYCQYAGIDSKINSCACNFREIIKMALNNDVSGIIICHNHPNSNLLFPSKEDINLTRDLYYLCNELQIELFDHLIVSKTKAYSFDDKGVLSSLASTKSTDKIYAGIIKKHFAPLNKLIPNLQRLTTELQKFIQGEK